MEIILDHSENYKELGLKMRYEVVDCPDDTMYYTKTFTVPSDYLKSYTIETDQVEYEKLEFVRLFKVSNRPLLYKITDQSFNRCKQLYNKRQFNDVHENAIKSYQKSNKEAFDAAFAKFKDSYVNKIPVSNHQEFQIVTKDCTHEWKEYTGFMENYRYCTKCDKKDK